MSRIWAVLVREFSIRVKKKSFVVLTILGPLLMAGLILIPALMMMVGGEQRLAVLDQQGEFLERLQEALQPGDEGAGGGQQAYRIEEVRPGPAGLEPARQELSRRVAEGELDAYLIIGPELEAESNFTYYSRNITNFTEQERIEGALREAATDLRLAARLPDLGPAEREALTRPVTLDVIKLGMEGEETKGSKASRAISFIVNYGLVFVFYMTFVLWGLAIMRGVVEEKSSRVIEVLLSSVTPFQLMMGKILGIGLVGLTQVAVWAASGSAILAYSARRSDLSELVGGLHPALFLYFLIFYVLGYFLYACLFAGVGSVCNTDQEAQQAQTPVVMLLIVPLMTVLYFINNPTSTAAVVMSFIPFFTPFIMFVRISTVTPPFWQVGLSLLLMVGTILLLVWLVARIFRVGILMYGKRPGVLEIARWLRRA